jgi:hypothetical protein
LTKGKLGPIVARTRRAAEITTSCGVGRPSPRHTEAVPLVEFTRFRMQPDNVPTALAARAVLNDVLRSDWAGFVGSMLIQIDAWDWLDLAVWEDEAACDAALTGVSRAMATFLGLIEEVVGQERGTVVEIGWESLTT